MRILVLHNTYQRRGGEDVVVDAEVDLLRNAGHTVRLEILNNDALIRPADKINAFVKAPYDAARAIWAADLVRETGAEIVHVHNFFPLMTPAVHQGAVRAGAAVVQTLHNFRLLCGNALFLRDGMICEKCLTGSNIWGIVHRCYRDSLPGSVAVVRMQWRAAREQTWRRDVHRFIALTDFARNKFIEGGLPSERIAVKPNFVKREDSGATPLNQIPSRSGALFVGRLSSEKGVPILLECWRRFPNHPLTIVGDGPERSNLEASAGPNVTFLGQRSTSEVRALMQQAAFLVAPSIWYEGFPMTVVEAFSTGLPVIASRLGSLAEIIQDHGNGRLFEAGDAQDLARVVSEVLLTNELPRLIEGATSSYERRYTPDTNLATLESVYIAALEVRAAAGR